MPVRSDVRLLATDASINTASGRHEQLVTFHRATMVR